MNAPRRFRTLYQIGGPQRDTRRALGTAPVKPGWPAVSCAHCWELTGALIQATGHDTAGNPCCQVCAGNANRRVM